MSVVDARNNALRLWAGFVVGFDCLDNTIQDKGAKVAQSIAVFTVNMPEMSVMINAASLEYCPARSFNFSERQVGGKAKKLLVHCSNPLQSLLNAE